MMIRRQNASYGPFVWRAVSVAVFLFFGLTPAWANVEQVKIYKATFSGSKPKCIHCHTLAQPKKEAGKHELNDYGKKLIAAKKGEKPDASTYQAVGPFQ